MDNQSSTYPPPPSTPSTPLPQNVVLSFISGTTVENTPTRLLEIGGELGVGEGGMGSSSLIDPVLKGSGIGSGKGTDKRESSSMAISSADFKAPGFGSTDEIVEEKGDGSGSSKLKTKSPIVDTSGLGTSMPSSPPAREFIDNKYHAPPQQSSYLQVYNDLTHGHDNSLHGSDALNNSSGDAKQRNIDASSHEQGGLVSSMVCTEAADLSSPSSRRTEGLGVDVSMCESGVDARELPSLTLETKPPIALHDEDVSSNIHEEDTQETLDVGSSLIRENEELSMIVLDFEDNSEVMDVVVSSEGDSARERKTDISTVLGTSDDFLRDTGDEQSREPDSEALPSDTGLGSDIKDFEPTTMDSLLAKGAQQMSNSDFTDLTVEGHRQGPDVRTSGGSRSTTEEEANIGASELPKLKSDNEQANQILAHTSRTEILDSDVSELYDEYEGDQSSGKSKAAVAKQDSTGDAGYIEPSEDVVPETLPHGNRTIESGSRDGSGIDNESVVIGKSGTNARMKASDSEVETDDRIPETMSTSGGANVEAQRSSLAIEGKAGEVEMIVLKEIPDSTETPSLLEQSSVSAGISHVKEISVQNSSVQDVTTAYKSVGMDVNPSDTVEPPGSSPAPPSSSSSSLQQPSIVVDIPPSAPVSPNLSRMRTGGSHVSSQSKKDAKPSSPTKPIYSVETPPPKKKQKTRSENDAMDETNEVTDEITPLRNKDDILMDELKAMKVASIQARNATLEAEIARVKARLEAVTEELEYVFILHLLFYLTPLFFSEGVSGLKLTKIQTSSSRNSKNTYPSPTSV
jgi:uncharacterized small protein (DUF1192 family)